jgi:hypothetical protein
VIRKVLLAFLLSVICFHRAEALTCPSGLTESGEGSYVWGGITTTIKTDAKCLIFYSHKNIDLTGPKTKMLLYRKSSSPFNLKFEVKRKVWFPVVSWKNRGEHDFDGGDIGSVSDSGVIIGGTTKSYEGVVKAKLVRIKKGQKFPHSASETYNGTAPSIVCGYSALSSMASLFSGSSLSDGFFGCVSDIPFPGPPTFNKVYSQDLAPYVEALTLPALMANGSTFARPLIQLKDAQGYSMFLQAAFSGDLSPRMKDASGVSLPTCKRFPNPRHPFIYCAKVPGQLLTGRLDLTEAQKEKEAAMLYLPHMVGACKSTCSNPDNWQECIDQGSCNVDSYIGYSPRPSLLDSGMALGAWSSGIRGTKWWVKPRIYPQGNKTTPALNLPSSAEEFYEIYLNGETYVEESKYLYGLELTAIIPAYKIVDGKEVNEFTYMAIRTPEHGAAENPSCNAVTVIQDNANRNAVFENGILLQKHKQIDYISGQLRDSSKCWCDEANGCTKPVAKNCNGTPINHDPKATAEYCPGRFPIINGDSSLYPRVCLKVNKVWGYDANNNDKWPVAEKDEDLCHHSTGDGFVTIPVIPTPDGPGSSGEESSTPTPAPPPAPEAPAPPPAPARPNRGFGTSTGGRV